MEAYEYERERPILSVEEEAMRQDIQQYGMQQEGIYKDVSWSMKRPYGTYWCGYVTSEINTTKDMLDKLEAIAHGGLTARLGFDCSHCHDYPTSGHFNKTAKFRDYNYVLGNIKEMIDYINNSVKI